MKMELPEICPEERTPLVESLLAMIRIQQRPHPAIGRDGPTVA
jgi:hypothetical protein